MARIGKALLATFLVSFCISGARCQRGDNPAGRELRKSHSLGLRMISPEEAATHPKLPSSRHRTGFVPPQAFDARLRWPHCASIRTIRNQGHCGTCWAVSAASILSDRLCITRNLTDFVSSSQVAGCTYPKHNATENCKAGGDPAKAFQAASLNGFSSGGEYSSKDGCVPYPIPPYGPGPTELTCASACTNKWPTDLVSDSSARVVESHWLSYGPDSMPQSEIDANVLKMQEEIFTYGPISALVEIYSDMESWLPYRGPYVRGLNTTILGGHVVKVIGWNRTSAGISYWVASNSWGAAWGDNGTWWVKMGDNTAQIEQYTSAPIVKARLAPLPACSTKSFCTAPIDQAVKMDHSDPDSPTYLFQGNCVLQVDVNPYSKLQAVGKAKPISEVFDQVFPPVVAQKVYRGALSLLNATGYGGTDCKKSTGSDGYHCTRGSKSVQPSPYAITSTGVTYSYDTNAFPGWMLKGNQANKSVRKVWIGNLLTRHTNMATVRAFLSCGDYGLFVFGETSTGKPLTGLLTYPDAYNSYQWWVKPTSPDLLQIC